MTLPCTIALILQLVGSVLPVQSAKCSALTHPLMCTSTNYKCQVLGKWERPLVNEHNLRKKQELIYSNIKGETCNKNEISRLVLIIKLWQSASWPTGSGPLAMALQIAVTAIAFLIKT